MRADTRENIWTIDVRHRISFEFRVNMEMKTEHWRDWQKVRRDWTNGERRPSTNDWFWRRGPLANTWSFSSCPSSFASNFQWRKKSTVGVNKLILSELAPTRPIVFKCFLPSTFIVPAAIRRKTRLTACDWNRLLFAPHCATFRYFEGGEYRRFDSAFGNFLTNLLWNGRNLRLLICIMYQSIVFAWNILIQAELLRVKKR